MTSLQLWRKQGCGLLFWLTNCDRTEDSLAIVEPSNHLTTLIKPPRCRSDVCCRHGRGDDVSLRRPANMLTTSNTRTIIWMNENGAAVILKITKHVIPSLLSAPRATLAACTTRERSEPQHLSCGNGALN